VRCHYVVYLALQNRLHASVSFYDLNGILIFDNKYCHVYGDRRDENNGFYVDQMIGFIGTYVTISLNYNYYSAIADLHKLQFTVTQAIGFSVFITRLLVTELKQSHCD
jgi:hypothetical protein